MSYFSCEHPEHYNEHKTTECFKNQIVELKSHLAQAERGRDETKRFLDTANKMLEDRWNDLQRTEAQVKDLEARAETLQRERDELLKMLNDNARIQAEMDLLSGKKAIPPLPTPGEEKKAMDAIQDDIAEMLRVLGLGDRARPKSPHLVVQDEVIPAIRALREAAMGALEALKYIEEKKIAEFERGWNEEIMALEAALTPSQGEEKP